MGWLWASSSRTSPVSSDDTVSTSPAASSRVALTEEQKLRIFGRPGASTAAPQTREQQADAELDAFIRSLESNDAPAKQTGREPSSPATVPREAATPLTYDRVRADGSLDISPDAIYPRTMSCRQAFDQAFYCQSLGGKFNDIYRYGHLRSCSEQWGAFWFCMRTRTLPDLERQREVKAYYASRDEQRKQEFGSSEDVWRIRTTAVPRAFDRDPDADEEHRDTLVKE